MYVCQITTITSANVSGNTINTYMISMCCNYARFLFYMSALHLNDHTRTNHNERHVGHIAHLRNISHLEHSYDYTS